MQFSRMAIVGLFALAITGSVLAQAKEPKASDVLKLVPAGSMGVMVVNDVKKTTDNIDQFLTALGVMDDMKKSGMDKGVLDAMLKTAQIEAGFRKEGGFAAAVMDPQQFGVDLGKAVMGLIGGEGDQKIPFAIYIPAKSIKDLFANYEVTAKPEGKGYQQVTLPVGQLFVAEANGYVILSPLEKVLDAVTNIKKSALDEMSKEQLAAVSGNEIAIAINWKVAGPWYDKLLQKMQEMERPSRGGGGPEAVFENISKEMTAMTRKQIADWESITIGARFVPEGIVIDAQMSFVKDSPSAKALAQAKPIDKSRLSLLPATDYVFALDFASQGGEEALKQRQEMVGKILGAVGSETLTDAQKKQIQEIIEGVAKQVSGGQLVVGGGPNGKGALAAAMVLQVNDSAEFKKLLSQSVDLTNKLIGAEPTTKRAADAAGEEPAAQKFSLSYKAAAVKAGGTAVDAVVLNAPIPDGAKEKMMKIIGDDQVRFLIASPTKDTVVITFGGAAAQMEAALKTATAGGGLDLAKASVNGMKYMPDKPQAIAALNITNLLKVIKSASEEENIPVLKTDAPVLMGGASSGTTGKGVVFVPTAVIKDFVEAAKAESAKRANRAHEGTPETVPPTDY